MTYVRCCGYFTESGTVSCLRVNEGARYVRWQLRSVFERERDDGIGCLDYSIPSNVVVCCAGGQAEVWKRVWCEALEIRVLLCSRVCLARPRLHFELAVPRHPTS